MLVYPDCHPNSLYDHPAIRSVMVEVPHLLIIPFSLLFTTPRGRAHHSPDLVGISHIPESASHLIVDRATLTRTDTYPTPPKSIGWSRNRFRYQNYCVPHTPRLNRLRNRLAIRYLSRHVWTRHTPYPLLAIIPHTPK